MANTQQTWTKLPDGTYRNDSTFQIINPKDLTPDQAVRMGIPKNTEPTMAEQLSAVANPNNFSDPAVQKANPQGYEDYVYQSRAKNPYQSLTDKIYGRNPQDYAGVFSTARENLGQPSGGDNAIISGGTQALAEQFVNRVLQKTGRLPSEDQVRGFVSENLNSTFAEKFIKGINNDQLISNYVDPYLNEKPEILADPNAAKNAATAEEQRILGLNKQLDELYGLGKEKTTQDIEDAYGLQKRNVVNDLAGQGMLTQPTSRLTLNELEASKGKSLSQALASLAGDRARGSLDLSKTIETLLANERGAKEQSRQFGMDYGLRKRATGAAEEESAFNRRIAQQQIDLAKKLGQMQANASKPNLFSSALGGATGGATIGSKFGVPGALIGAGAGGLAGILSSLR
jgi:hypothetical protein